MELFIVPFNVPFNVPYKLALLFMCLLCVCLVCVATSCTPASWLLPTAVAGTASAFIFRSSLLRSYLAGGFRGLSRSAIANEVKGKFTVFGNKIVWATVFGLSNEKRKEKAQNKKTGCRKKIVGPHEKDC